MNSEFALIQTHTHRAVLQMALALTKVECWFYLCRQQVDGPQLLIHNS